GLAIFGHDHPRRSPSVFRRMLLGPRLLGNIVPGVFTPVLAKHSKSLSLIDCISVGVDRMQRNFEPMRKQEEAWQRSELTDVSAKVVIYEAFVEGKLEAPKPLPGRSMISTSSQVRAVSVTNNLEPLECLHLGLQRTGAHSAILGYGEPG